MFCFGVREALSLALRTHDPQSVTVHGELVHNPRVLVQLALRGFQSTAEPDRAGLPNTPRVMITAHGISDRERNRLESAGLRLIDTTCPLVRRVHRAAQALADEGRHVVVIGRPGHVEVAGIVEDLPEADVVAGPEAVRTYPHARLGVVCQSTTSPRLAACICAAIRAANPGADIEFVDTICQPTRDRQEAVGRLLPQVDGVVVVGGRNSNNTRELAALCEAAGKPAWLVQSAGDLDPRWFRNCRAVGLTAGTSTLDETIQEVHQALLAIEA
ncbi:MAG: 4-hydroxy-3-methylbut-2-enyl diphosphate reductase [Planctomycetaceae bacterium]|nr:4-hydroxy-3-methylbut-2-enyl diphosphate reductase [Planctomycetaceae bacterium]